MCCLLKCPDINMNLRIHCSENLCFILNVFFYKQRMKRLFVGGLFPGVTEDDIIERFKRFGEITGVEIKKKKTTDTGIDIM